MEEAFQKDLDSIHMALTEISSFRVFGNILSMRGLTIQSSVNFKGVSMGCFCKIYKDGLVYVGEVVAMAKNVATIFLASPMEGLSVGDSVEYLCAPFQINPSDAWQGRIISAFAEPLDDKGPLPFGLHRLSTKTIPLPASKRMKLEEPLDLGVRSLNAFTTACKGQRLGIFAGSGVGKSVLLSMLARFAACDVCVIGLIGERGRELKEFTQDTLGEKGLAKSVVVVATSDEPPLTRRQAAYTTLTIAEYFRNQGKNVLCIIDSLTRFAMAQREIGLSAGEPPTTKGYPPSVFSELARLCERAGPGLEKREENLDKTKKNHGDFSTPGGMITGFFSVLVDGDDMNEPIADAVRGILDGHIVLDRKIAERGIYPAVNVLKSLSRLSNVAQSTSEQALISETRRILSTFEDMSDLIRMGAYHAGANFDVDLSIKIQHLMEEGFFRQSPTEPIGLTETFSTLEKIIKG